MKISIPSGYLAIFISSILAGFLIGSKLDLGDVIGEHSRAAMKMQHNILFIGTDTLGSQNAQLQSIWLLIYFPNDPQISLVPIYPNGSFQIEQELAQAFRIDPQGHPHPTFLQTLEWIASTWWDGYLLADQATMVEIIEALGGDFLEIDEREGKQVFNRRTWPGLNTQPSLNYQTQVIKDACTLLAERLSQAEAGDTLAKLHSISERQLRTNLDLDQLLFNRQPEARLGQFECLFPLEETPSIP